MISARQVKKRYVDADGAEVKVLEGADLEVKAGEFVAVVGPSGCGKSTLLHILGGLDAHFEGEVEVCGQKLAALSERALARFRNEQVGFVFQSFHLVQGLSALENVLLPSFFSATGLSEAGRRRGREALERVGLGAKAERIPSQLSGGERQRIAIARALFSQPKVLLCDEPTGNLDQRTGEEVIALFQSLHKEGLTLLCVTHEERMSSAAQRVLRLREGKLWPEGLGANGHASAAGRERPLSGGAA
jgi:putative ABC transport system ATP-binding protein